MKFNRSWKCAALVSILLAAIATSFLELGEADINLAPRFSYHSLWTIVPAAQIEEERRTLGRNGSLILDWEDSEPSALVDSAGLKAVEFRGAGSLGVRDEDAKRSRLAHFPPPFPAPFPILRYFQITQKHTHTNDYNNPYYQLLDRNLRLEICLRQHINEKNI